MGTHAMQQHKRLEDPFRQAACKPEGSHAAVNACRFEPSSHDDIIPDRCVGHIALASQCCQMMRAPSLLSLLLLLPPRRHQQ